MRRLVFIDDDKTELVAFRGIVAGEYEYFTIHWPNDSVRLFAMSAPDIFVSDLYLPPPTGDSVPTEAQRNEASEQARKVAESFARLYSNTLDDKARLQETMKAIADAYAMLSLQWVALGQSPDHGVAVLARVQAQYPDVPFVFYSRKITPEDVIRVLRAGAVDAIRKGALKREEVLARLAAAQEYRRKDVHRRNVNVTLFPQT
jgi:DNA-binding NarL/FixJ family response regulator